MTLFLTHLEMEFLEYHLGLTCCRRVINWIPKHWAFKEQQKHRQEIGQFLVLQVLLNTKKDHKYKELVEGQTDKQKSEMKTWTFFGEKKALLKKQISRTRARALLHRVFQKQSKVKRNETAAVVVVVVETPGSVVVLESRRKVLTRDRKTTVPLNE